ncbi:alpha/beta-hydrolase, partial [Aureobasidium pullulans]
QNKKIDSGASFENGTRKIQIETIGLVNGWVDMLTQAASYLSFPFNNTYGIQMTSSSVQEEITTSFHRPGGCCDITEKCQSAAETYDPENTAINATVNELCFKSAYYCTKYIRGPLAETQKYAPFDIGHYQPDPFPYNYFIGFLNQDWVREGLGVPVNFTSHSNLVFTGYIKTGTFALPWALPALGGLLDSGVKVAMMYGDRDLDVNWIGGEQVSLKVNYSSSNQFSRSGYEDIILDGNHVAGSTRQYGNFSFSRVFEAGNRVPTYQPQAAYEIFMRAMFGKDIATGAIDVDDHYSSVGEPSSWHHRSALPKMPAPECYIWAPKTCTSAQVQALADGTAWVRDYIVLD